MKTKYFNLIKDIKDKDLIISLYFTQMLLLTIAFILGIFLFDSFSAFLALFTIVDSNILIVGGTAGLIVVLVDLFFMKLVPKNYYDDGGLNERIFQNRPFISYCYDCGSSGDRGRDIVQRGDSNSFWFDCFELTICTCALPLFI